MMSPDLSRITVPCERRQLLAYRAPDYWFKRPSWQVGQLAYCVNADVGQPRPRSRPHSPHQLDWQAVKEVQLLLGIDHHEPVGLGHLRGNFREVLGARYANRDWEAQLCAHTTADGCRDLRRRTEKVSTSRNVSESLIDGNSLDPRREIIEHIDGSIAEPLVFLEVPADKARIPQNSITMVAPILGKARWIRTCGEFDRLKAPVLLSSEKPCCRTKIESLRENLGERNRFGLAACGHGAEP
jgi:hypothetical protein